MKTVSTTMFNAVHLRKMIADQQEEVEEKIPDTERDPNPHRKETLRDFPSPSPSRT